MKQLEARDLIIVGRGARGRIPNISSNPSATATISGTHHQTVHGLTAGFSTLPFMQSTHHTSQPIDPQQDAFGNEVAIVAQQLGYHGREGKSALGHCAEAALASGVSASLLVIHNRNVE